MRCFKLVIVPQYKTKVICVNAKDSSLICSLGNPGSKNQ